MLSFIVGALSQYRVKRLLAYSSISHVGFLILALAVNSVSSVNSLLFYLVQTTFFSLARLGSARSNVQPPTLSFLRKERGEGFHTFTTQPAPSGVILYTQ